MSRIAYVNGRYVPHDQAAVHIEDRGFQFADSIYEVCAVEDGFFVDERPHYDRMVRSLAALEIDPPLGFEALRVVYREVVRRNRLSSAIVYCQVTRGQARRDHAFPRPVPEPTIVVTAKRIDREKIQGVRDNGIRVIGAPDNRWGRCDIKSTGLLANVLAKQAARSGGAYEAWFVDSDGNVTEGTSTNAWIVVDGTLITRPLDDHILGGVTRASLIAVAREAGIDVEERKFSLTEAKQAEEAFSSASTVGAMPVISIDDAQISGGKVGPVTSRLNALYAAKAQKGT